MDRAWVIVGLLMFSLLILGCSGIQSNEAQKCPSTCNDNNPCTDDQCSPSTNFLCVHTPLTGSSPGCSGTAGLCSRYTCDNGACITQPLVPCCGNGICETGETYVTCANDCKPKLKLTVEGCDSNFDISHQLGWVADVYVYVANVGDADATGVTVSVSSSKAGKGVHPDQTRTIGDLPMNTQTLVKLTIDTDAKNRDIPVDIVATGSSNIRATTTSGSCGQIDPSLIENIGKILPYLG